MAHQMMIAHSNLFLGSGTFAGGPYNCSRGDSQRAKDICMKMPELIQSKDLINDITSFANSGLIHSPIELNNKKIFIFHGTMDPTIAPVASNRIEEIYTHFKAKILFEKNIAAGHGLPTLLTDQKCELTKAPWLNNCQFDGVGKMFNWFYGNLKPATDAIPENMYSFDQLEFSNLSPHFSQEGQVYIPKNCMGGSAQCKLHIALHGCLQNPQFAGNEYITNAGYNPWAESNSIVILYPSIVASRVNPQGCWDWFGYTDKKYNTKEGVQIEILKKMIYQLIGK